MQQFGGREFSGAIVDPLLDYWRPDVHRLEREVIEAEIRGCPDDLALAEIECSMDLIDAELVAVRARPSAFDDSSSTADELAKTRARLQGLANRLQVLGSRGTLAA